MIKLFKHATAAPSNSFHREGEGRMEILGFAVEYLGMKTPLSHRFVGRKKDISGHFGGRTTARKFPSLVHGNIHDDFLQLPAVPGGKIGSTA
jgi:hypothetical protein